MKIVIVGPTIFQNKSGGVALFSESLGDGFLKNGFDVAIVTDISDKNKTKNGTPVFSTGKKLSLRNLMNLKKIENLVNQLEPDLIITSLAYSIPFIYKKTSYKKIHFLHGFPSIKYYGAIKFFLMNQLDKIISKKFDYVFANSNFTRLINEDFYNVKVNRTIHIGLGYSFFTNFQMSSEEELGKKSSIIYAGRLVEAKHIDKIIKAYQDIDEEIKKSHKLDIIGYGEEELILKKLADKKDHNIHFLGPVKSEEMSNIYKKSKVFISLNPHEPFGMVYLEALINGCYIICPETGGQIEFLKDYPERVSFVDINDHEMIIEAINEGIHSKIPLLPLEEMKSKYSYDIVAKEIMKSIYL